MKHIHLLVLSGFILFFTSCINDKDIPVYEEVEGVVLENGQAVSNADIHIRNHFNPGGFSQENAAEEYTINFTIQSEAVYTISLFRHGADSIFYTFFDDTLAPGNQEIIIPDSLLTNGILGYEIETNQDLVTRNLFLVNKPDSLLPGSFPFTTTNALGEFTLNQNYLALGLGFRSIDGFFEVTDSLQIYVVQDSSIQAKRTVEVKPNKSNFFEIVLD
ncbi:hypothetical protein [Gracilimonas sp.]|uniref:hypothetical protein n=1 Tax=Gracilimonas sp. TaxID=1974203 RepID=UPI0032EE9E4A